MRLEQLVSNPLRLAVIMLLGLGVIAVVISAQHQLLFADSRQAQNGTPASSFNVKNDPKPLPKVAEHSTGTSTSPASEPEDTLESVVPGVKPEDKAKECATEMAAAQQKYDREVQKEKNALDDRLSFRVGLNISSQYIADYNDKVTALFNEYANEAKAENCVWPVKELPLLSIDDLL